MLSSARSGAALTVRDHVLLDTSSIASEVWIVGGLIVLAAVLRFATISGQSFWLDEAQTVHELRLSFGAMLHAVHVNESTPPLYFVIAWLWSKLFGTSEAGVRSLSALAGVSVIPITYLCARELVSRRAAVGAAALASISPFMVWYSQEARSYMLFAALSGASFLFFARSLRRPSRGNLAMWSAFSSLAVLTHFFAGFLVAPEAIWLLYTLRSRAAVLSVGVAALVQLAVLPLAIGDTSHTGNWIAAFPFSTRLQQMPVGFAFGNLMQSSLVHAGLLIAAAVAAVVVVLLVIGADGRELRGAGTAAAIAAAVVFLPIALALLGHDYVITRNLIPAWIPLAVVLGAACTASRARAPAAAFAVVVLAAFVWAGVQTSEHWYNQRPDWRGVAAALGSATHPRAIVAYDGTFAAAPLAIYLPRVAWTASLGQDPQPSRSPVTVGEVDIVGSTFEKVTTALPPGVTLLRSTHVDRYLVERYALRTDWRLTRVQIAARARALLGPAPANPAVIVQRPA